MMDEQRAWVRLKKRKYLRILAVILSVCLLVTTYPNILTALSVFATEWKDSTVYVSGFAELSEAVRGQTVPVGTDISELELPDTLEAFAAAAESTNPSEDSTGEQGGDTGNPDGNGEDEEEPAEEENEDIEEPDAESDEDNNDAEAEALSVQSGVFVIPVYMAEPVVTVETQSLERKEETVMIKDVTWQSEPAYDGNIEGTYIFTAVLPEGYALSEGLSLPQITVTVQGRGEDAVVQALLARIATLPNVQEYMEKEPDIDNWKEDNDAYEKAYEEWMEGLSVYAEEVLAIWEAYKALTVVGERDGTDRTGCGGRRQDCPIR